MPAPLKATCVTEVLGLRRRLFRVTEMPKDKSAMISRLCADAMGPGWGEEYEDRHIIEEKFTVHTSAGSPQGVNWIKFRIKFADLSERECEHVTAALKVHNQFVPVFILRVQDLRLEKYLDLKRPLIPIDLGTYDPGQQTLVYGVFVGNRGKIFVTMLAPDLKFRYVDFGPFRIVVIWSLVTLPSGQTACQMRVSTKVPGGLTENQAGVALRRVEGLDADGCLMVFRSYRDILVQDYEDFLLQKN